MTWLPQSSRDAPRPPGHSWWPPAILAVLVGVFCGLAWFSARHINTLWDEANDHEVAVSLLERPLVGSGLDGSQARLPMYVTAAVYAITGPSIQAARAVSIIMGAAAIVLTYLLGRRWFGTLAGLLAAGLLSVAPYFLTFARTALTEGDAFYPATVLLMFLAFDRYLERRDSVRLGVFAASWGLALATKFYAVFFVPALILCDLLEMRRRAGRELHRRSERGVHGPPIRLEDSTRIGGRGMLIWACSALGLLLTAAAFAQLGWGTPGAILWAGGLIVLAAGPIDQAFLGTSTRHTARRLIRWNTPGGWIVALPLGLAVCLAICPAHVLNPEIARALARSLVRPMDPETMVRFVDPARLYIGIILLKAGPLLGVLMPAAIVWACLRKDASGLTPPGPALLRASTVIYIFFLLMLPLRQSFYLMGVYPLLILLLTSFVVQVTVRLRTRERLTSAWVALVATGCLYLLWGTVWSYPQFGYYGYTLIGDRWMGAESRGYRNLIQVTNDGTEEAMAWLAANVPPGRRVVSYLWDDHVIDRWLEQRSILFHLVRRNAWAAREIPPEIEDADYVVVALNNEVSYRDLPPRQELDKGFEPLPAYVVWRGRGHRRFPVVQIFVRKPDDRTSSPAG